MYNQEHITPLEQRGSSSLAGTAHLCRQLPEIFNKHNIRSMFDAGANDAAWQARTLAHMVEYHAGERNAPIVAVAKKIFPDIDICVHDMTQDPFPKVDLLFVRDAAIHLNNFYKHCLLKNWLNSEIPWLMITQINDCRLNTDQDQTPGQWYAADVNWHLEPWNFPPAREYVEDLHPEAIDFLGPNVPIQRFMCLWHRDQIKII